MTLRLVVAGLAMFAACKESPPAPRPSPSSGPETPVSPATAGVAPAAARAAPPTPPAGAGSAAPVPGTADPAQAHTGALPVIHGDKWQDAEEQGGVRFTAFKETWVYVDGVPKGAILFAELPASLPVAWKDDVEGLDFHPGDGKPKEKKVQFARWRLADYFKLIGIDVAKIKMVYLHGSGYVAIPGDRFRKFADGITFDLTGNDLSVIRFYWPTSMPTNTSYDRYAVVSVFIDKPLLHLDEHNNPFIDGVEVAGVPYHGTPERGGFRVYVDYKLAMVVKRNELGKVGQLGPERWDLAALLAAHGVKVHPVAGDLIYAKDMTKQKRERLDEAYVKDLSLGVSAQASGTLLVGKEDRPATALHLYTRGHVPPVVALPEFERDPPAGTK
jgi:hypothetical protein